VLQQGDISEVAEPYMKDEKVCGCLKMSVQILHVLLEINRIYSC